ncbi:hypothetical protein PAXRUDRAFT_17573 [Paxillus rubicundulus Ve08.2h10]|uniref:Uncharacterized protein n=1 Tax=Paxillus rubicundulus Ve08.2h10 TaxID=930991 RepID=A0A0D0C2D1_9AGAM|nr:hypothetical protein PAXRUDRAFT_17573 [Paxillus rubicundulus Ve08.2h10]
MPKKTYKSAEFVPSSVDEDSDSAAKVVQMKQLVVQPATRGNLATGKLVLENISEGYLVYDPKEPRKKIGEVIKVKPRQPGEIDDGAVFIIGQRSTPAPKLTQKQFGELGEAITTLEAQSAALVEQAEEYRAEFRAALMKIQQGNLALVIYEAMEKEMVELRAEQIRAMNIFKGGMD